MILQLSLTEKVDCNNVFFRWIRGTVEPFQEFDDVKNIKHFNFSFELEKMANFNNFHYELFGACVIFLF